MARTGKRCARFLRCACPVASPALAGDGDGGTQSVFCARGRFRGISARPGVYHARDDATAIYGDPAALRNVQTQQLSFMYMPLYGDFTEATYMRFALGTDALRRGLRPRIHARADHRSTATTSSAAAGEGEYSENQFMIVTRSNGSSKWIAGRLATGAFVQDR